MHDSMSLIRSRPKASYSSYLVFMFHQILQKPGQFVTFDSTVTILTYIVNQKYELTQLFTIDTLVTLIKSIMTVKRKTDYNMNTSFIGETHVTYTVSIFANVLMCFPRNPLASMPDERCIIRL